jgi:hypothetical protein
MIGDDDEDFFDSLVDDNGTKLSMLSSIELDPNATEMKTYFQIEGPPPPENKSTPIQIISDEDKYYIDNYGFNKSYCNEITLYFSEVIQNFINKNGKNIRTCIKYRNKMISGIKWGLRMKFNISSHLSVQENKISWHFVDTNYLSSINCDLDKLNSYLNDTTGNITIIEMYLYNDYLYGKDIRFCFLVDLPK